MFYQQLRNEVWKLFGKKRTYMGFVVFFVTQNLILLIMQFPRVTHLMRRLLEDNGYSIEPSYSSLTFATGMIFPIAHILLPVFLAMVSGDLVAKESEDGTLRLVLARPISRVRLLFLKWLAGALFSASLVLSLGTFGLLFAAIWFPWRGLFVYAPNEIFSVFDASMGFHRYLGAHLLLVATAITITSVAFMFSCFKIKPAAAAVLTLSVVFLSMILQDIPYFRELKPWFFTHHLNVWHACFAERIAWWRVGGSLTLLAGMSATCCIVGCAVFQARDIKS